MFWSLTYLDHRHVIVPLQLLVTRKQRENVAVISSSITWLLINLSNIPVANVLLAGIFLVDPLFSSIANVFMYVASEAGIYRIKQGIYRAKQGIYEKDPCQ